MHGAHRTLDALVSGVCQAQTCLDKWKINPFEKPTIYIKAFSVMV